MLPFIRSDLAQFTAYTANSIGTTGKSVESSIRSDRLDANENPFDMPSELKAKLAWAYQQIIETNRYPDGKNTELKEAIASYVNQSAALSDSSFTSANISIGNGSDELIRSLVIATCLGGEGAVLVANPTFSMYTVLAQTLGIPVVDVGRKAENFEIDLVAATSAIEQTQNPPIRVVFVVHPNSPTGNALTAAELAWLSSLPDEILVVVDEAYFEFSQTTVVSELLQRRNWAVLRTFSKAFRLAAHRVGYCVAHPDLIAALEKIRLPYNVPTFSQAAALVTLQNSQMLLELIPEILAQRVKLSQALAQHPALKVYDSAANFIFLQLKNTDYQTGTNEPLNQLHQQLQANGTDVRLVSNGLRITIGTPEENSRTLNRLQAALETGARG
jgi:histidinol-phosphate aminotransferase